MRMKLNQVVQNWKKIIMQLKVNYIKYISSTQRSEIKKIIIHKLEWTGAQGDWTDLLLLDQPGIHGDWLDLL